jgi:uncharacterized protein (DUF488 family)
MSLPEFLAKLKDASVEVLFDIRYRPQSRKPGFSKNALAAACEEAGISYRHDPDLGTPPDHMAEMRLAGEYTIEIFERYRGHLLTKGGALDKAADVVKAQSTCLVCYEADYRGCHRRVVAEEIERLSGMVVQHLAGESAAAKR